MISIEAYRLSIGNLTIHLGSWIYALFAMELEFVGGGGVIKTALLKPSKFITLFFFCIIMLLKFRWYRDKPRSYFCH